MSFKFSKSLGINEVHHTTLLPFFWLMVAFVSFPAMLSGQAITGFSGYFSIPVAELSPDKSVNVGYNQLNRKYYGFYNRKYDLDVGFIDVGFLPFMEVGIRMTRPRGFQTEKKTTWDRMISSRILPLEETKYFPAIALGFQGFFTTEKNGGANFFNSSYIVVTKNFKSDWLIKKFGCSLGYGNDIIKATTYQFIGFFGGIKITPLQLDFLELMLEYDAEKWNAGARVTILKHVIIIAGYEGMDAFSGGLSYRLFLP
jgi:hypothetical protein